MDQPSILRFSTAEIPERDRLDVFREMFGRGVANMDITPLGEQHHAELEAHLLPGASVTWGGNSPHRFEKGRDPGRTDDDCLIAWATTPGRFEHLGREITVGAGPAVLLSGAEKTVVENRKPIRHVTVKIPRAVLKPLVVGLEDTFMRPIPEENDALRLLKIYLATVRANDIAGNAELQHAIVLHICDLVALALGTTRDASELAARRSLPAARLDAIKKQIFQHLGDGAFSVNDVARAQAVTPRYVQMLFEGEGTTFSSFLLQSRLALAHRRLSNPTGASRSISAIALDCGFGDLSYFNQCFRRTYGETPSDVRQRASVSPAPDRRIQE